MVWLTRAVQLGIRHTVDHRLHGSHYYGASNRHLYAILACLLMLFAQLLQQVLCGEGDANGGQWA